jgi:aspartate/methionine/tyrosine aminotransferase
MTLEASSRARAIAPTLIRALRDAARPTSLDLGLGQPDLPVPAPIREALGEAVARGVAPYSPNMGLMGLREAVAARYGCDAAQVMITCGVQEALAVALLGLVEPGDEVLVPEPGFPAYPNLVRMAGGVPVPYALEAGTWALDVAAVEAAMTPRTRVLLLNSPGNPTGAVAGEEALRAVLDLCRARDVAWVSDEIYEDYIWEGEHRSPGHYAEHVASGVRCGGLSKSQHMMGWRVGWLLGPAGLMEGLRPLHQHLVTCAPEPVQRAAQVAVTRHDELFAPTRRVFARRRQVALDGVAQMAGVGLAAAPAGAFYLFVDVRRFIPRQGSSLTLARAILDEVDVITIPGVGFGQAGEGYLRLAYTIDEAPLADALERLREFFVVAPTYG